MNVKSFNERYGRATLIVTTLLIWAWIIRSFFTLGYAETWEMWRVPTLLPPFFDFRLIAGSTETFQAGMDPSISNPNDPGERTFNYPKIWYIFFHLNISQSDTVWICVILLVLSFLTFFSFPREIHAIDVLLMVLVIFSPACMLLYERGNVDLVFFIMLGLFIILMERQHFVALSVLLVAAFFKFFPFFGVIALFQENKNRFYRFFSSVVGVFLVYILLNIEGLKASWTLTERATRYSYGARIIFDIGYPYIRYYLIKLMPENQIQALLPAMQYTLLIMVLGLAFWLAVGQKRGFVSVYDKNITAFRVGAAIYVGTFLLGNNWDYRMIFLIFAVPQLAEWIFRSGSRPRYISVVVLIALVVSTWGFLIYSYLLMIWGRGQRFYFQVFDEVVNWTLFAGLAYLLVASAPSWFRTFSWNPFSRNSQLSEEAR